MTLLKSQNFEHANIAALQVDDPGWTFSPEDAFLSEEAHSGSKSLAYSANIQCRYAAPSSSKTMFFAFWYKINHQLTVWPNRVIFDFTGQSYGYCGEVILNDDKTMELHPVLGEPWDTTLLTLEPNVWNYFECKVTAVNNPPGVAAGEYVIKMNGGIILEAPVGTDSSYSGTVDVNGIRFYGTGETSDQKSYVDNLVIWDDDDTGDDWDDWISSSPQVTKYLGHSIGLGLG